MDNTNVQRVLNDLYVEDQDFLQSYDMAPTPPSPPTTRLQVVSLSLSSCVSLVELVDVRGVRGWGRSPIILRRESLVLYNH